MTTILFKNTLNRFTSPRERAVACLPSCIMYPFASHEMSKSSLPKWRAKSKHATAASHSQAPRTGSSAPLFYRTTTSPCTPFTSPSPDARAQSAHGLPSGLRVSTRHASSPPSFITLPTSASPTFLSPPRRTASLTSPLTSGSHRPSSISPAAARRTAGRRGPPLPHPPPRRPPPI
jgi:hypothetical protein